MPAATYTKNGTKAASAIKLPASVFAQREVNPSLLAQAYSAYLANGRSNLALAKTRGLVRGGGRKPWRQKGTGRARVGSRRTPLWRGGGIVFGPTGEENYSKKFNLKAKRAALVMALSAMNQAGNIILIEDISLKAPKTAELAKLLQKIGAKGYCLVVSAGLNEDLALASRNLSDVKLIQANYLNVARVMDADTIVMTKAAVATIEGWLSPKANKSGDK